MKKVLPLLKESSLRDALDNLAHPAELNEKEGNFIRCHACAHRCKLKPGQHGLCGIRFNEDGQMFAPRNYIARRYVRPIESNTPFHILSGCSALTYGMYGCDLRCGYCQNWYISQALREETDEHPIKISAKALISEAIEADAKAVCAGYNEPLISAEWLKEIFSTAKRHGLATVITSDGNTTNEVLEYIRPVTDAIRIDLKAHDDEGYRSLGGRYNPVINAIKKIHKMGIWLEIVTLVTPGLNDSAKRMRETAELIAEIDPNIPWHLNAALPRYHHNGKAPSTWLIDSFFDIGRKAGLRYIYTGNLQDARSNTRCTKCDALLVQRKNYRAMTVDIQKNGKCPNCGNLSPGLWSKDCVDRNRRKVQRIAKKNKRKQKVAA